MNSSQRDGKNALLSPRASITQPLYYPELGKAPEDRTILTTYAIALLSLLTFADETTALWMITILSIGRKCCSVNVKECV